MATRTTSVKLILRVTTFILRILLNIIFYILVVMAIVHFSKVAYKFAYQLYGPVSMDEAPGKEVYFKIKKGDSTMDVASKLEFNRVIENKYSFFLKAKLEKSAIKPGTYVINSAMTYEEILNTITDYSASIVQEDVAPDQDNKDNESNNKNVPKKESKTSKENDTDSKENSESTQDGIGDGGTKR